MTKTDQRKQKRLLPSSWLMMWTTLVLLAAFVLKGGAATSNQGKPTRHRFGSSVVLPITGSVYPDGYYFVNIKIGNPPKDYDLDIDTGSDLTWVQCDAPCTGCTKPRDFQYKPKHNTLPCNHVMCTSLHSPVQHQCEQPDDQCDYDTTYADLTSSMGILVSDVFPMKLTNGTATRASLAFGCGYNQEYRGGHSPPPTAGVLGLGKGDISISAQLYNQGISKNVLGHCISHKGGGFLFFGDELVPTTKMSWTSLVEHPTSNHYLTGPAQLLFNGKSTGLKDINLIFDSGSSYSYFNTQTYQATLDLIKSNLNGTPLKETNDGTLPICWKDSKPSKSILDVKNYFKTITFRFEDAQLHIPPESYLIVTQTGNVCFGILHGTEVGLENSNLVGDIFFQGLMVVYDNDMQKIGWFPTDCDRIPNVDCDYNGDFSQPYGSGLSFFGIQESCAIPTYVN